MSTTHDFSGGLRELDLLRCRGCSGSCCGHCGRRLLEINPVQSGDHKPETREVLVVMATIDCLLAARGWSEVSLLKADVLGAEARMLAGAHETIERFRLALLLEVSDEALKRYGSSAEELLADCTKRRDTIHTLNRDTISVSLAIN